MTDGPLQRDEVDLSRWRALWEEDGRFEVPRRPGLKGALVAAARRLLRPLLAAPLGELWERQRAYNLLVQTQLERREADDAAIRELTEAVASLGRDLQSVQRELGRDLSHAEKQLEAAIRIAVNDAKNERGQLLSYVDAHEKQIRRMALLESEGFDEVKRHHEAVFSLLEHRLEQYRQSAGELRARLVSLLKVAESGGAPALEAAVGEQAYLELERRHRGTEEEIAARIEPYLGFFKPPSQFRGSGEVLDLGCGRGEALALLGARGIPARGVDSNAEMVARCGEKKLAAEVGDLFEVLAGATAESLGGVISFHVIEHLPAAALEQLVLLSWRALEPGGVLILETPSPLSLVVGARNFWLDPTHQRPVHPESLELLFEEAGFEGVERIDRQPFADSERLPELPTAELTGDVQRLAHEINHLRDQLDSLLYGYQVYGMVGHKPERA